MGLKGLIFRFNSVKSKPCATIGTDRGLKRNYLSLKPERETDLGIKGLVWG